MDLDLIELDQEADFEDNPEFTARWWERRVYPMASNRF
jgi:hypothetical protein